MCLKRQTDDKLLEKIKKIDKGPKEELKKDGRESKNP